MEEWLSSKLNANNRAVKEAVAMAKVTEEALEALEDKVDGNEASLMCSIAVP